MGTPPKVAGCVGRGSAGATVVQRWGRAERSSRATAGMVSRSVALSVMKTTRLTRRPVGSSTSASSCRLWLVRKMGQKGVSTKKVFLILIRKLPKDSPGKGVSS